MEDMDVMVKKEQKHNIDIEKKDCMKCMAICYNYCLKKYGSDGIIKCDAFIDTYKYIYKQQILEKQMLNDTKKK